MKRRDFLGASAALALAGCSGNSEMGALLPGPLPEPERLVSSPGRLTTELIVSRLDDLLGTRCYNGKPVGPTLRVQRGDLLQVQLRNHLPANTDAIVDFNFPHHFNTTNLHFHGLHVSPLEPQDNVLIAVEPGQDYLYQLQIPVDHPDGTFWYHPHAHGSAALQLLSGMVGVLIVEGPLDAQLAALGIEESILLLHELFSELNSNSAPFADPRAFLAQAPEMTVVNGQKTPTLKLKSGQLHRLRLVNGSVFFDRELGLEGHDMHAVAYDGITLARPEMVQQLHLAPANRADVLIRPGAPGRYEFRSLPYDQGFGPSPQQVLFYIEVEPAALVPTPLPTTLPAPLADLPAAEFERTLVFELLPPATNFPFGQWQIDGKKFDNHRVDQQIPLGRTEDWTIMNTSVEDHPFHIHTNPFQLLAFNGEVLDVPRWYDTINIPKFGSIRIRQQFKDFSGMTVLHCHILLHECQGMMQLIDIVPPTASREERRQRRVAMGRARHLLESRQQAFEEFCGPRPRRRLRWG